MKIFIVCSKKFYGRVHAIESELETLGHEVFLPNCINDPESEAKAKLLGANEHIKFKQEMFKRSEETIAGMDSMLVLNYDRDDIHGYIGGATFLEMYDAFRLGKKIFLLQAISESILSDEIKGFSPSILNGDLKLIK